MKNMRLILPLAAALLLGAAPLSARDDSFSDQGPDGPAGPPGPGLYERISAHYGPMGRDVEERFRDGPCRIERRWETDGDFEETIRCRGPRD
jgi:hypothetical protein